MGVEGVSGGEGVKWEVELGYAATLKISAVRKQNTFTSAVSVDTNNTFYTQLVFRAVSKNFLAEYLPYMYICSVSNTVSLVESSPVFSGRDDMTS